ncbi:uncharacterized protein B0T23DRAFT_370975 [Neurospora hispaniola]|uniref:Uncharacterized protein n=1 Tax=Neurospora hispaniola TaxID=588809 RepID=A0AAJ0IGD5_9PEZI|nr:hypothetical protein B0T23DRAFT_370975 [Neurospora hispaniola]
MTIYLYRTLSMPSVLGTAVQLTYQFTMPKLEVRYTESGMPWVILGAQPIRTLDASNNRERSSERDTAGRRRRATQDEAFSMNQCVDEWPEPSAFREILTAVSDLTMLWLRAAACEIRHNDDADVALDRALRFSSFLDVEGFKPMITTTARTGRGFGVRHWRK